MIARRVLQPLSAVILSTTLLIAPQSSHADEIEETIQRALEYYQSGEISDAVVELEFAIQDIKGIMSQSYGETFPEPLEGWSAEDVVADQSTAFVGGEVLNRSYRQDDGNGRFEAQLMVDSPLIQGLAVVLNNPAISGGANAKRVRIGRDNAMVSYDANAKSGEANLAIASRVLIKITGSNIESREALEEMIKAWDFDGLKAAAGI